MRLRFILLINVFCDDQHDMTQRSQRTHPALSSGSRLALVLLFGSVLTLTPIANGQTLTVIHDFAGSDGQQPKVGLTIDAAGKLYGTTFGGGSGNAGVVYRVTRAGSGWVLNPLYNFRGGPDGA